MSEQEYRNCFICGKDNPIGLQLDFYKDEDDAYCIWNTDERYEGYPGIIHGGIVSSLLDEVMAKCLLFEGRKAVTTEINVKFLKAALCGKEYKVIGRIVNDRKRIIECEAFICDNKDNEYIIARASAVFFQVK